MLIFTNDDYRRIQAWLKANSVKDSELPHFTSENGSEKIAIVQDGKNVLITLNELKQLIGGIVRVLTPPTISNVDNNVVIDAKIYDKIYYTVSTTTDYYPYLDSTGKPIDIVNTSEYNQPFPIDKNVIVRAIAVFTNSEGEILKSTITEELVYLQKTLDAPNIEFEETTNIVTLENPNDEGDIYYTLDGNTPTVESNKYVEPFKITNDCTIKAIVVVDTSVSKVAYKELSFYIREIPVPTPNNLTYNGSLQYAFSSNDDYSVSDGVVSGTDAGEYSVKFILNNPTETKWKDIDRGISEVKVSWSIKRKQTTITWNVSTEYEVGNTIPAATSSDSFNVEHYRDGILIDLPYVVKDGDIGTLTITAKNILPDEAKNNYEGASVTEKFTIKEQSIPWQYATISEEELDTVMTNVDMDSVDNPFNSLKLSYFNGIEFTDVNSDELSIEIEGGKPYLILSYPTGNKNFIAADTMGNPYDSDDVYMGHNSVDNPNIKTYYFASPTTVILKKTIKN